jgi:hypothetical protein
MGVTTRERKCAHCRRGASDGAHLVLVLTCERNVYAYRWLCQLCRARRSRRGGTRRRRAEG